VLPWPDDVVGAVALLAAPAEVVWAWAEFDAPAAPVSQGGGWVLPWPAAPGNGPCAWPDPPGVWPDPPGNWPWPPSPCRPAGSPGGLLGTMGTAMAVADPASKQRPSRASSCGLGPSLKGDRAVRLLTAAGKKRRALRQCHHESNMMQSS
jgi:hypothetical protein